MTVPFTLRNDSAVCKRGVCTMGGRGSPTLWHSPFVSRDAAEELLAEKVNFAFDQESASPWLQQREQSGAMQDPGCLCRGSCVRQKERVCRKRVSAEG